MSRSTKEPKGELTKALLSLVAGFEGAAYLPRAADIIEHFAPSGRDERNRIWKTIKYLEEKKRIALEVRDDTQYVRITTVGRDVIASYTVWNILIERPEAWDRKWRLVMFDFPTEHSKTRHVFRSKLEHLGFRPYQRSVFIYPFECQSEVEAIAKWCGADTYVRYVVAIDIHDVSHFIKIFQLR